MSYDYSYGVLFIIFAKNALRGKGNQEIA